MEESELLCTKSLYRTPPISNPQSRLPIPPPLARPAAHSHPPGGIPYSSDDMSGECPMCGDGPPTIPPSSSEVSRHEVPLSLASCSLGSSTLGAESSLPDGLKSASCLSSRAEVAEFGNFMAA